MKKQNIPYGFIPLKDMQKILNCSRQWIYTLCLIHKMEKIRIGKFAYVKLNSESK